MIDLDFCELANLLTGKPVLDVACPLCGPQRRDPKNRSRKVLRLWSGLGIISYHCARCGEHGYVLDGEHKAVDNKAWQHQREAMKRQDREDRERRIAGARELWAESLDPRGTWAEEYLASRSLRLPVDPEVLLRTLRFHPRCPFPDGRTQPALLAAFTPVGTELPDDPFLDPPPIAIHRIRGRGHTNKAMIGPVRGSAIMLSPWWHVRQALDVCEGVETALALYGEGAKDHPPEDRHRPIWALGSAGAIAAFPVIARVLLLRIFADHDASGTGVEAARACAARWIAAGKLAVIRTLAEKGLDYAD